MEIIKNLTEIKQLNIPLAMALGNFDGVHKGHQALIKKCVEESRERSWFSSVLLWEPHPADIIYEENKLKYLNTSPLKYSLMEALGIQYLFILPFDKRVAYLSPLDFVQEYLVELFKVSKVFIGFNFTFGEKGTGTPEMLKLLGSKLDFEVSISEAVIINSKTVSSSLIRETLAEGDIDEAAMLLGYYPILEGEVVSGDQRGTIMGFPTANLEVPENQVLPAYGVYACLTKYHGKLLPSIVNIGVKPTFGSDKVTVEVHIMDFDKNIYNQKLSIYLIRNIRYERKFIDAGELKAQINKDISVARQVLTQVLDSNNSLPNWQIYPE
jgi:riboflavin kinase/FMN adenylyltransferase